MRVLVVGAGAIGALVGGKLALAGHGVTLVARPALAARLRAHGLTVIEGGQRHAPPPLSVATSVAEAAAAPPYDWLALTVKAYDVAGAAEEIAAAFAAPPPVVTFQNGVGSEETVAGVVGADRVAAVSVTIPVTAPAPGQVEARRKGGLAVAPYGLPGQPRAASEQLAASVAAALGGAGFVTRSYPDYREMKWSKLLLNIIGNATSAILDLPPAEVFADRRLFRVELAALREALAVMQAWRLGVVSLPGVRAGALPWALRAIPTPLLQPLLRRLVAGGRGGKMPSLHLDLAAGRPRSEVQVLNGAVVTWGAQVGVRAPVNQALTDTLVSLVEGRRRWDELRRQPERLLALVG